MPARAASITEGAHMTLPPGLWGSAMLTRTPPRFNARPRVSFVRRAARAGTLRHSRRRPRRAHLRRAPRPRVQRRGLEPRPAHGSRGDPRAGGHAPDELAGAA